MIGKEKKKLRYIFDGDIQYKEDELKALTDLQTLLLKQKVTILPLYFVAHFKLLSKMNSIAETQVSSGQQVQPGQDVDEDDSVPRVNPKYFPLDPLFRARNFPSILLNPYLFSE